GATPPLVGAWEAPCPKIIGRRPHKDDIVQAVREYVVHRLAKGATPFEAVARHFNMRNKTLERRLGERDTNYRDLVDGVRYDLARPYLADTDLRLPQIAFQV